MFGRSVEQTVASKRGESQVKRYQFPLSQSAFSMVLVFRDYDYKATKSGFGSSDRISAEAKTSAGIALPIPQNLVDNISVKVGPYELGTIGGLALETATAEGLGDQLMNDLKSLAGQDSVSFDTMLSTFKAASKFTSRNFLDALPGGGGISAAIDVATGTAINPHVALKFDGVDLKQHTFTWQLSPRNEAESEELKKIINFIKSRILPEYSVNGESPISRLMYKYPSLVDVYFTGLNQDYFYHFKTSMVNTFNVDYTPNGVAVQRGGKPSFINMTMTITEAQVHTRNDYKIED